MSSEVTAISREPQSPFLDWLQQVSPSWQWEWPHIAYLCGHLERLTAGEITKVMFFLPPRHGKTSLVTIRYAMWRLEGTPALRIIVGAYNQSLANRFSRRALRIATRRGIPLNSKRVAAQEWETLVGGGLRAVGVGAGITGHGGDLIIIDDPVRNREEADSPAYRERVWEWYTNDLYTRREPGARMCLIMTRWNPDDLAGRILASEDGPNWVVVNLPALAKENDPLGRAEGAALCPARYDEEELEKIRVAVGVRVFEGLYQGSPLPPLGALVQASWISYVEPAELPPLRTRVRYWDKGAALDGAYTAGVLMSRGSDGVFYVEHVIRGRWLAHVRDQIILETARQDRSILPTAVWIEQEPGSGGDDSARATLRLLAGFPVYAERPTGSKVSRFDPFASQVGGGNVRLVRGSWNQSYLSEICAFPLSPYADQADASSGAFNRLVSNLVAPLSIEQPGQVSRWGARSGAKWRGVS